MQRLMVLGLNHTTAPLELREKLAFNAQQRSAALEDFRRRFPQCEIVLLSTCNRVELYVAPEIAGQPDHKQLVEFLAVFHSVPGEHLRPHLYEKSDRQMAEHLFSVASSLDSMVLGESQILGQVREAYDAARAISATGPLLNPLFQRAIAVGKQVMHQTPLGDGRLSIASVAVDYARRIFDHFNDKAVLSIGAGKMAQLVLRHFAAVAAKRLLICNRDLSKAKVLAEQFHGEAVGLEQLDEHLTDVDVVITSTGAEHPLITADRFAAVQRRRRFRPIFIIDIALPRDVEAAVGNIENVYLYNLDDLQQVVSQTHAGRQGAIDDARKIVSSAVHEYVRSHRIRALGPVIDQLYQRYHQLAKDELARTLNKLPNITDAEKEHLEELARRMVNKLLHDPVQALRAMEESHVPQGQYLHAVEQLFKLKLNDSPDDDVVSS